MQVQYIFSLTLVKSLFSLTKSELRYLLALLAAFTLCMSVSQYYETTSAKFPKPVTTWVRVIVAHVDMHLSVGS